MNGTILVFRVLVLTTATSFGDVGVDVDGCLVLGRVSCNLIAVSKSILRNVCHKRKSSFSCGCSRNNHFFI